MPYELSEKAAEDLGLIYDFGSERFGIQQADRFFSELKGALDLVGEKPRICHLREEFTGAIRIQVHKSHLIIYTIQEPATLILRIVHGHYNWQQEFAED